MVQTPHKDKLLAAINNPKCTADDKVILSEAVKAYESWMTKVQQIKSTKNNVL